MSETIKNISVRLKISRIASGHKTAKDFTEKHSISASTYCQHELGKRSLSIENLLNYADLTRVDPAWLLTGQGNPCGEYGDKDLENQILKEQARLENTGKLKSNQIPQIELAQLYSRVNIAIFKKILQELLPLIKNIPESKSDEVINFCFELYNRIISTNVEGEERAKFIRICLESFFNGLGLRIKDETLDKVSMII
jgi:transcriptional regulator with XRE-family HTH domain